MSDLRLLIAEALNSSDLSSSDLHETHLDRVGALAFTDALGGALWAVRYAAEVRAYPRALALLTHRSRRVFDGLRLRTKMCEVTLQEWLDPLCRSCGGRQWLAAKFDAPIRPCLACNATGQRRFSGQWRMRRMGLDVSGYKHWERRFETAHSKISEAERKTWLDISLQLDRLPLDDRRRLAHASGHTVEPAAERSGVG